MTALVKNGDPWQRIQSCYLFTTGAYGEYNRTIGSFYAGTVPLLYLGGLPLRSRRQALGRIG
ncbi:hypothetical protein C7212DRAFT_317963, partial [Tuber magnatum]